MFIEEVFEIGDIIIFIVAILGIILAFSGILNWGDRLKEIFMNNYSKGAFNFILLASLVGFLFGFLVESIGMILGFGIFSTLVCLYLYGTYEASHVNELIAWHFALAISCLFILMLYAISRLEKSNRKKR